MSNEDRTDEKEILERTNPAVANIPLYADPQKAPYGEKRASQEVRLKQAHRRAVEDKQKS